MWKLSRGAAPSYSTETRTKADNKTKSHTKAKAEPKTKTDTKAKAETKTNLPSLQELRS